MIITTVSEIKAPKEVSDRGEVIYFRDEGCGHGQPRLVQTQGTMPECASDIISGACLEGCHQVIQVHASCNECEPPVYIVRFADLVELAKQVFAGNMEHAWGWLREPHPLLDGKVPLELAKTKAGSELVSELLWKIEYGIPP